MLCITCYHHQRTDILLVVWSDDLPIILPVYQIFVNVLNMEYDPNIMKYFSFMCVVCRIVLHFLYIPMEKNLQ